jgi:acyl-CoA synthetase (AMP-forming)/AMP-acid ligase II
VAPPEQGGPPAFLWNAFHSRTGRLGDRIAVESAGAELTFDAMWSEAERLASRLLAAGVEEGSVAGLALGNTPRFLTAFLALCRLDATVALLPPQYSRGELEAIARGIGLGSIVVETERAHEVGAGLPLAQSAVVDGLELLVLAGAAGAKQPEALLKFSSGSTAEPKGVALTAANLLAEAETVCATLDIGPGDRVLAGVPLFHSYGFDLGVLPALYAGTTLVLEDVFVPRRTLTALSEAGVTAFLGVPAHYRAFLETRVASPPELGAVRWLLSCTAPLPPDLVGAFFDRFGVPICQHYGSSETGAATLHVPSEVLRRPASVGRAMKGVSVAVVDDEGNDLPGDEGEVVVESGAVAGRYVLGAPRERSPLRNGSFRTGDLGRIDADGFLSLAGRRDSMINVGGLKVSPLEVATVLERHPAVREAAVLGVPGGRDEEVVYAAVALAESVDEPELLAFCRKSLAEYKVPRRIEIRDALPRTPAGKVRLKPEDLSV